MVTFITIGQWNGKCFRIKNLGSSPILMNNCPNVQRLLTESSENVFECQWGEPNQIYFLGENFGFEGPRVKDLKWQELI